MIVKLCGFWASTKYISAGRSSYICSEILLQTRYEDIRTLSVRLESSDSNPCFARGMSKSTVFAREMEVLISC